MNTTLTGTALTLHNLGVAAGFGGSLFGQMALQPAAKTIGNQAQRGELLHQAWRNYGPANVAGLAMVGLTWIAGRSMLSGGEISGDTRALVIAKDILVATYVATGLGSIGFGIAGSRQGEGSTGLLDDQKVAQSYKASSVLGRINIVAAAAIIAVTAILNVRASRSPRWSFITRLLP